MSDDRIGYSGREAWSIEFQARARVWSGRGVTAERVRVQRSQDGVDVSVWDGVAGHYTVCHSASPATLARLRRLGRDRMSAHGYTSI